MRLLKSNLVVLLVLVALILPSQAGNWALFATTGRWLLAQMLPSLRPSAFSVQDTSSSASSDEERISHENLPDDMSNVIANRFGELAQNLSADILVDTIVDLNATDIEAPTTLQTILTLENDESPDPNANDTLVNSFGGETFSLHRNRFIPEASANTPPPRIDTDEDLSLALALANNDTSTDEEATEGTLLFKPEVVEIVTADTLNAIDGKQSTEAESQSVSGGGGEIPKKVSLGQLIYGKYTTLPSQIELEDDGKVYEVSYN